MDRFISGALYAVSRKCERLAETLAGLHDQLPKDPRADLARALAKRQQLSMTQEAKIAEGLAKGILEMADSADAASARKREMRRYRRCVAAGRFAEYYVVPFLRGFDEKAMELTDLCRMIAETVNWPHSGWPLVSRGATNYFLFIAEADEELILAPALAGTSVLPLPDLVHEMAHPLVRTERRQSLLGDWGRNEYVSERVIAKLGRSDSAFVGNAVRHWLEHGVEEIACDAIAAWVTGPAYAWQHIQACWDQKEGKSVYDDSDYHPPENARFEAILYTLSQVGGKAELEDIKEAWAHVVGDGEATDDHTEIAASSTTPYPTELVLELAEEVVRGCVRVGIRRFPDELEPDDPCRVFSDGWLEMRNDPVAFHAKERKR